MVAHLASCSLTHAEQASSHPCLTPFSTTTCVSWGLLPTKRPALHSLSQRLPVDSSTQDSGSIPLSSSVLLCKVGSLICAPEIVGTHPVVYRRLLAPCPGRRSPALAPSLSLTHSACSVKAPISSDCPGQLNLSVPANQAP